MTCKLKTRSSAKLGLILATSLACGLASAQFNYPNFNSTTGINLVGATSSVNGSLFLTPMQTGTGGNAWYATPQNVAVGFESDFVFRDTAPWWGGGDGFTFTIQNQDPNFFSAAALGGGLGYTDALSNSVVVEFDIYANQGCEPLSPIEWVPDWNGNWYPFDWSQWYGPGFVQDSNNHVAIQTMGTGVNTDNYNVSGIGCGFPNFYIGDGREHSVRVVYSAFVHTLSVYLDGSSQPIATASIDLSTKLSLDQGRAWVGFTAATGGAESSNEILSWNYQVDNLGAIQAIRTSVSDLVNQGAGLPANGQPLFAKLDTASAALKAGDTATATSSLQDFINQVRAFIRTHKLTPGQGQPLIDSAQAIINSL